MNANVPPPTEADGMDVCHNPVPLSAVPGLYANPASLALLIVILCLVQVKTPPAYVSVFPHCVCLSSSLSVLLF